MDNSTPSALKGIQVAMAKAGEDFELLVKSIYEEILSKEGFKTIKVSHDVKIKGKSGQAHQIDVYWEFNIAGITHRVAVECKEYKNSVSVGKIRDFHGAIHDIGNTKGIFVTTNGYQKGAVQYGEHVGIDLKTVSDPMQSELDLLSGVNTLQLNGRALYIDQCEMSPVFDMRWVKDNTNLKAGDYINFNGMNDEVCVVNSNGDKLHSILDLENMLPRGTLAREGLSHTYPFDNGYLLVPDSSLKPLKLESIKLTYDVCVLETSNTLRFKTIAKAILKDILSGECFLHKEESCIE